VWSYRGDSGVSVTDEAENHSLEGSTFRAAYAQIKGLIEQGQALFNNEAYQQTNLTFE
jgi:hypothetical protein